MLVTVANIACGALRSPREQKLAVIVPCRAKAVSQKGLMKVALRNLKLHCLDFECLIKSVFMCHFLSFVYCDYL